LDLLDALGVRGGAAGGTGAVVRRVLGDRQTGIRRAAERAGCHPDTVLVSAAALVESRLTGASTVRVSVPQAGDPAVRSVSVHVTAAGPAPVADWLRGVERQLQAPAPPPDAGHAGVLYWGAGGNAGDRVVRMLAVDAGKALEVAVTGEDSTDAAGRFADLWLEALDAVTAGLDGPLDALRRSDAAKWRNWLEASGARRPPRHSPDTLTARFSAAAATHGNAVAVIDGVRRCTYAELEQRSAHVAQALLEAGLQPGGVVALALDRSLAAIVAILGTLKAGGAYLPLDARLPLERRRFMLEDCAARVMIRGSDGERDLDDAVGRLVTLDSEGLPVGHARGAARLLPTLAAEFLAYVMYTSGSTGRPKGVAVEHRNVVRLVATPDFVRLGPDAVFLQAAPLGFDASTLEIWGTLLHGGRLVIHPEALPTPAGLEATIGREGVTTAWLTAALFNAVVDASPRHLAGLRELLVGGEALSVPHVRRTLAELPGTTLINGYGPTECTTFAATWRIPRDLPATATSVPIGFPIAETELLIVNAVGEPVPPGCVGELLIGGTGVARGYVARPELTAERFVTRPELSESRLYRTGDLARYLPDGSVEFVGRVDGQLKIRGFRIEPGEIAAAIAAHPAVQSAAVVARRDRPGEPRLVAYAVPRHAEVPFAELRAFLARTLPDFMWPAAVVWLPALPVTANGKLDARALPAPSSTRPDLAQAYEAPRTETERRVCEEFATMLGLDRVGRRDGFFDLGGTSLLAVRLVGRLGSAGRPLSVATFFRDPSPAALARAIEGTAAAPAGAAADLAGAREPRGSAPTGSGDVAVIGMAVRLPGAGSLEKFWENLLGGVESIRQFTAEEIDAGVPAELRDDPAYVRARGVIDDVELFDAAFFGIPPREAELMDPQQRIFLELAWECLERAGYVPDACPVPVGVFAGMYNGTYFQKHVQHYPDRIANVGAFTVMLGNEKDYIATRTAHRLNLTGPAISVHTACSTSLVAIAQAFDSVRSGRCGMALAGGSSVTCPPNSGYRYEEGAMLSPDGHTRTFDADAAGTVFSDGAAAVLLKRLPDAIRDGDTIYAVLRGAAVNNDGAVKASFTAPSVDGQMAVIRAAQADAAVDPASIDYVEAHGTATPLGDPIEIEALRLAFGDGPRAAPCLVGSVKSNIGHTVIAAGAAGLIKTVLALEHETLPGTLHFRAPNPRIGFDGGPFRVAAGTTPWPRGPRPRRAGVSSFGVGGTNAHVIVEEAPPAPVAPVSTGPQLLRISARSPAALATTCGNLAARLRAAPPLDLADVAFTLRVGRKEFPWRATCVAATASEAADKLAAAAPRAAPVSGAPRVAFMFPGQGAQYARMGSRLYAMDPHVRESMERCFAAVQEAVGLDLRRVLLEGTDADLVPTAVTQPALFTVELALARRFIARGVEPAALVGHSVGEFVAAVLAEVMTLEDAARLVAVRGRLMQAQPTGSMLTVRAPAEQVSGRLPAGVEVAAVNGPRVTVVAGPTPAIEALAAELTAEGLAARVLQTSHAFHSPMMEPAVGAFASALAGVALRAPRLPIASTSTGTWLKDEEATSVEYWSRHLRRPVLFAAAAATLLADAGLVLLEVGPRTTLTTLARQQIPDAALAGRRAVATLQDAAELEPAAVLEASGRLWELGVAVGEDPSDAPRRRVCLPTYPFERKRFWVEAPVHGGPVRAAATPIPATESAAVAPATPRSTSAATPTIPTTDGKVSAAAPAGVVQQVIQQQMQIMAQQLAMLARAPGPARGRAAATAVPVPGAAAPAPPAARAPAAPTGDPAADTPIPR
jgi:amino acid adenylation domain-containing protein